MKTYTFTRAADSVPLVADWDADAWREIPSIAIDTFRPESSDHHPETNVRAQYTDDALHLIYRVADRYVRAVSPGYNAGVCTDSCVEFFVRPRAEGGYFNFEMNCGGTLLCSYVEDWRRIPGGFEKYEMVSSELGRAVEIKTTLPRVVDPEIADPTTWCLALKIPLAVLAHYIGKIGALSGQRWRANFYKCGDDTSHPHWAAWSEVRELNFHDPECFGEIAFA